VVLYDADRKNKLAKDKIKELIDFISGEQTKDNKVTSFMQIIDKHNVELLNE
jgi:hypothetical protein